MKQAAEKLQRHCHAGFQYAEHACAIGYAVAEFSSIHLLIIVASGLLLVYFSGLGIVTLIERI